MESSSASKDASTMLGETPTVNQRRPLLRSRLSIRTRHGVRASCEDTHLEVRKLQILNGRLIDAGAEEPHAQFDKRDMKTEPRLNW